MYEYVIAQPEPVSRAEAAAATGVALPNASFHLDRLADEGLLEVGYRRLSGRSGPGSGRPSKLYRWADPPINVSLPPRRYEVLGEILAEAVSRGRSVASRAEDSPATGLICGLSQAYGRAWSRVSGSTRSTCASNRNPVTAACGRTGEVSRKHALRIITDQLETRR